MSKPGPAGMMLAAALLVAMAGCVTPNRLAQRLVTAPNQQGQNPIAQMAAAWDKSLATRDPFIRHRIGAGPPPAEIAFAELPPGKYEVDFSSELKPAPDGGKELHFHFHFKNAGNVKPVSRERGLILLVHGYMMSKEVTYPWAFVLARVGFRVVTVDLRGHGESSGDTVSFGKKETSDLAQILDYLTEQGSVNGPVGVLGLSLGADLALHWAAQDERVKTVVAIAPYNQPEDAFLRVAREMGIRLSDKVAGEAMALAAERIGVAWRDWSGESALRQLGVPVFFVGGAEDRIVPQTELEYLHRIAPAGSELLVVPGVNHDAIGLALHEIGKPILLWFARQLTGLGDQLDDLEAATGK